MHSHHPPRSAPCDSKRQDGKCRQQKNPPRPSPSNENGIHRNSSVASCSMKCAAYTKPEGQENSIADSTTYVVATPPRVSREGEADRPSRNLLSLGTRPR